MRSQCMLSNVAKSYISEYYCILERMISGMTGSELTDSISGNFIVHMIPHHKAAIEMSENILKYTTNVTLQNLALGIVREQTQSIEDMSRIQCGCNDMCNSKCDVCLYQRGADQIIGTMFEQMKTAYSDNNINCSFIREMIPHHMGAVRMSENVLQYDICPQLVPILRAIIRSQKKEIAEMRNLMRCLGCRG